MVAMALGAAACTSSPLRSESQWEDRLRQSLSTSSSSRRGGSTAAGRSRSGAAGTVVARFSGGRGGRGYFGGGRRGRGRGRGGYDRDGDSDTVMNEGIRAPFLRLVGEDQQMIGVVSRDIAFQRAADAELDLVIVAADADPPVAKIMNFSKYKFEQQKKKRDQQKKAAATRVEIKEIKMRYNIDTHDYEVRLKQAQKFLKEGDKVKVFMPFRGREAQFKNLGLKLLQQFESDLAEIAVLETKSTDDGKTMTITLAPSKVPKPEKTSKSESQSVAKEAVAAAAPAVETNVVS